MTIYDNQTNLTYVLVARKNNLIEMVLLSTHNICFGCEIRKLILITLLSGCWKMIPKSSIVLLSPDEVGGIYNFCCFRPHFLSIRNHISVPIGQI